MNSRNKGKRGELEFAHWLTDRGYKSRRGQQHKGTPDSPDVITDLEGVHFEVKRVERLELHKALQQAIDEKGEGEMPVVAYRRNRSEWIAILRMEDLIDLDIAK